MSRYLLISMILFTITNMHAAGLAPDYFKKNPAIADRLLHDPIERAVIVDGVRYEGRLITQFHSRLTRRLVNCQTRRDLIIDASGTPILIETTTANTQN